MCDGSDDRRVACVSRHDQQALAAHLKQHHRHLRDALQRVTTTAPPSSSSAATATSVADEVQAWQSLLRSADEQQRLQSYAASMHALATLHWAAHGTTHTTADANVVPATRRNDNNDGDDGATSACACDADEAHCARADAHAACTSGRRMAMPDAAPDAASSSSSSLRRHDDRVQLCLDCIRDYFVGVPATRACATAAPQAAPLRDDACLLATRDDRRDDAPPRAHRRRVDDSADASDDGDGDGGGGDRCRVVGDGTVTATAPPPLLYASLPAIFARVLKPLRRAYYAQHGRTASAHEVEAMLLQLPCMREAAALDNNNNNDNNDNNNNNDNNGASTLPAHSALHTAAMYVHALADARQRASGTTVLSSSLSSQQQQQQQRPSSLPCAVAAMTSPSPSTALPHLRVLDVGSCYGPFHRARLVDTERGDIALHVVALDLQPYEDAEHDDDDHRSDHHDNARDDATAADMMGRDGGRRGRVATCDASSRATAAAPPSHRRVWQADWLAVSFFDPSRPPDVEDEHCCVERGLLRLRSRHNKHDNDDDDNGTSTAPSRRAVTCRDDASACAAHVQYDVSGIAVASFDVVVFCLLLSFLPTARLRYLACLHAYLALREGGLLVVVSTRTQNSRRQDWVKAWSSCINGIGFTRVHTQVRAQLVVLSFAKCALPPPSPLSSASSSSPSSLSLHTDAGRRAWLAHKLASEAAEHGLSTGADECV